MTNKASKIAGQMIEKLHQKKNGELNVGDPYYLESIDYMIRSFSNMTWHMKNISLITQKEYDDIKEELNRAKHFFLYGTL